MNKVLTSAQISKQKYEKQYCKVTLRLNPEVNNHLALLTQTHGSQKSALEYAIKSAALRSQLVNSELEKLKEENTALISKIEALENELKAAKMHSYSQEEREELLESILQEYENRKNQTFNINAALHELELSESLLDRIL